MWSFFYFFFKWTDINSYATEVLLGVRKLHLAFYRLQCILRRVKQTGALVKKVVRRVTGPVGCTAAAGMRGGIIIPGIIGGIMPGI